MDLQPFSVKLISLNYFTSFTAGVHAPQWRSDKGVRFLWLSCGACELCDIMGGGGTELGSSGRAVMALKGSAISLALAAPLLEATL